MSKVFWGWVRQLFPMSNTFKFEIDTLVEQEFACDSVEELQKVIWSDILDNAKEILKYDGPDDLADSLAKSIADYKSANWEALYEYYELKWDETYPEEE